MHRRKAPRNNRRCADHTMLHADPSRPARPAPRSPVTPVLATLLLFAVAGLDLVAGQQFSPWPLYLLPVAWLAYVRGRNAALAAVGLSALLIAAVAVLAGHPFASWTWFALSIANRAAALGVVALLVARLAAARRLLASQPGSGLGSYG